MNATALRCGGVSARGAHAGKGSRAGERGNVFFALFGAVAVVGVLGAGIMSTMRGPLTTMVQVNLREQAKSEMQTNLRLILANSSDQDTGVGDDLTEPLAPDISSCAAGSSAGQGCIPSTVGATINDPWGSAYRYCAWNLGADTDTESKWFSGEASTNNIAVALISPGPNKTYDNDCADAPTYVTGTPLDDDIIIRMTYVDAIAGSNGLWLPDDTDVNDPIATIDRSIDLTGSVGGTLASPQLRLGAASMLLPDETTLTTCNTANDGLLRINKSATYAVEVCEDGAGWIPAGGVWLPGTGDDIYYNTGTPQVGIGTASPDDTLDVDGTVQVTGDVEIGGNLDLSTANSFIDIGGSRISEVNSADIILTPGGGNVGIGTTSPSSPLEVATASAVTEDNIAEFAASNGRTLRVLQPDIADNATPFVFETNNSLLFRVDVYDALRVSSNGRVGIFTASPNQELDVTGDIQASGTYMIGGTVMLGNDAVATNVLLGPVASPVPGTTAEYMNLGDAIHADLLNKRVGVGFADTYDVSAFDDTLEVNGTIGLTGNLTLGGKLVADDNTSGNILVADGTNFESVAMSGDVGIASDGAATIQSNAVENSMMADNSVDIDELNASAGSGNLCLKSDSTTGLKFEACASSGGGDGLGGNGLPEVLANDNSANSLQINDVADPTSAQDAATKAYVDAQTTATVAGGVRKIIDADSDTQVIVDETLDEDYIRFDTFGSERMQIQADGDIQMDNNTLFVDAANNRVGVGTGSPDASIHVDSGTTDRAAVFVSSDATSYIEFIDDTGSASIGTTSSGAMRLFVDGVANEAIRIDNLGNVGVGTTSPEAVLDVAGTDAILFPRGTVANRPSVPVNGMMRYNSDNEKYEAYQNGSWQDIITSGAGGVTALSDNDGDTLIQVEESADEDYIRFDTAGTERMVIDDSGNVGVGTSSPAAALDVQGRLRVNNGNVAVIDFFDDNGADYTIGAGFGTNHYFGIGPESGDAVFRLSNDGDLALGGGDPDARLHVEEDSAATATVTNVARLTSTSTGIPAAGIGVGMEFEVETAADNNEVGASIEAVVTDVTSTSEDFDLVFNVMSAGNAADEKMRITSAGYVGIGTDSPSASLEVAGTDSILFPRGTVANRPSVPVNGMMRYNSDNDKYEAYQGGVWEDIITTGGGGTIALSDTDNDTLVQVEESADEDYIRFDTAGTERMVIQADGDVEMNTDTLFVDAANDRVGVGVGSPLYELHVNEEIVVGTSGTTGEIGFVHANGTLVGRVGSGVAADTGALGLYGYNGVIFDANGSDVSFKTSGPAIWDVYGGNEFSFNGYTGHGGEVVMKDRQSGDEVFHAYLADSNPRVLFPLASVGVAMTGVPAATLEVGGTDSILFPRGTSAQQPVSPVNGMMRYNSDNDKFEAYQGGVWGDIITSSASDIDFDDIVDAMTLDADTDVTMGSNDLSFNNGSALYIDGANNRVGIGAGAPSATLHVGGLARFDSTLYAINSSYYVRSTTDVNIGLIRIQDSTFANVGQLAAINLDGAGGASDWQFQDSIDDIYFSNSGNIGIGTTSPAAVLDVSGTDAILFPRGTSAQQPVSPVNGMMRYNSDNDKFEAYQGGAWSDIITSGVGGVSIDDLSDAERDDTNNNLFIGEVYGSALANNDNNTSVGIGALASLDNDATADYGDQNTAIGYSALALTTTGYRNTAVGYNALNANTTGYNNVAVGQQAGRYIADGSTDNATSDTSVFVGANTRASADGVSNEVVIGYDAIGSGTNTVTLGNSSITDTYLQGDVAVSGDLTVTGDDLVMGTNTDGAILVADGTNYNPVVASGDASIANDGSITIAADAIEESMLKAVDAAADEECLTYETTTGDFEWQDCTSGTLELVDADGDTKVQVEESADEDYIRFDTAGTQRVVINGSGLGVNASNPLYPLVANNSTADTNTVPTSLRLGHVTSATPAVGIGVGMDFWVETSDGNTETGAVIEAVTTDVTSTSEDFDLVFNVMSAGNAADEKMRITSAGYVGIGESSPAFALDVANDARIQGALRLEGQTSGTDSGLNLISQGGTTTYSLRADTFDGLTDNIRWRQSGSGFGALEWIWSATDQTGQAIAVNPNVPLIRGADHLRFYVGPSIGSTSEAMRIDESGNLSVGNADSASDGSGSGGQALLLDVGGAIGGTHYCDEDGLNCFVSTDVGSTALNLSDADGDTKVQVEESADEDYIRFDTAGTQRMQIDSAGEIRLIPNGAATGRLTFSSWSVGNTDIDGLLPGSTFGHVIEGPSTGHFVVGLDDNDPNDSFVVLSRGGDGPTDSNYDTVVFTATGAGKVGVGTSDPQADLEVAGTTMLLNRGGGDLGTNRLDASSFAWNNLIVGSSDSSHRYSGLVLAGYRDGNASSPLGRLSFHSWDQDAALQTTRGAEISSYPENTTTTDYGADLRFYTRTGTSALDLKMVIDPDGDVGIGTENPLDDLQVSRGSTASIAIQNTSGTGQSRLLFRDNSIYHQLRYDWDDDSFQFWRESSQLMEISSAGVGIGTTAPDTVFHIVSEEIGTGENKGFKISNYNETQEYSIRTGVTSINNTSLAFYDETSSANRMVINSSGKVGIGTDIPLQPLHVVNDYAADANTSRTVGKFERLYSGGAGVAGIGAHITLSTETTVEGNTLAIGRFRAVTTDATDGSVDSDIYLDPVSNNAVVSDAFVIKSTNAVGIGTASPEGLLHLQTETGDTELLIHADPNDDDEGNEPRIVFRSDGTRDYSAIWTGNIDGSNDNALVLANASGLGGGIRFATWNVADYTNAVTRMVVDTSGNVGIGTVLPDTILTVNADTTGTQTNALKIERTSGNSQYMVFSQGSSGHVLKTHNSTTNAKKLIIDSTTNTSNDATTGNEVGIHLRTLGTTRLNISEDGFIGLGLGDIDGQVTITGGSDVGAVNTAGQGSLVLQDDVDDSTGYKMRIDQNEVQTSNNGSATELLLNAFGGDISLGHHNPGDTDIDMNTGTIYALADPTSAQEAATKTYVDTAVSDERLKHNIVPFDDVGLDTVMSLRPVSYLWNDPTDEVTTGTQYGFIAQDIERVLPDLIVEKGNEMKTKTYKHRELMPFVVKAIQDVKVLIDDILSKIADVIDRVSVLEAENKILRDDVDALKAQNAVILERLEALEAQVDVRAAE
ncbi:MAG: tail fiber domain-containing protein [Alphaproteobacteria bacterium]